MNAAAPWWLWQRLAWRQAGALFAAIVLAGALVTWRTVATIRSIDDAALQSQAELIAERLTTGADGEPILQLTPQIRAAFTEPDGDSSYLVIDAHGRVRLASADFAEAVLPYLPAEGLFRVPPYAARRDGMVGAVLQSGPWRVAVLQGSEQSEALVSSVLRDLLASAAWLLAPLTLGTVAIGIVTTRRGLAPVRALSDAAARIGPADSGARLPVAGLPGEVAPLVAATNGALARLDRALDAQRRFVAEAAHALRTPLAILTARTDLLPPGPARVTLAADIERMSRLVGQMLTMSRLDELPLDLTANVDLAEVAAEAVSERAPLAVSRGIRLALQRPNGTLLRAGDHAALVLALGNLIDNALAYAPADSEVEVRAEERGLSVADRGPGVPPDMLEAIFTRFTRLTNAPPGGAGLGLSIVARVAAAHGGSAMAAMRPGGGAVFRLDLPVA